MSHFSGDPHNNPTSTLDPFKTLFVARIVSTLTIYLLLHAFKNKLNIVKYMCILRLTQF